MRILFLCGSLEPGLDGVGDYSRRLAGEIIRQGHDSTIVALNDKQIEIVTQNNQFDGTTEIKVLRLPTILSWSARMISVKAWIDEVNPHWISLQYVPFAFHHKGLPFHLASRLKKISIGRNWHIMFHELWVGMSIESSVKERLWGFMQRYLIKNLLKVLNPTIVHTHTGLYKKQLERCGARIFLLPLFSNIDIRYPEKIEKKLESNGPTESVINIVVFGGIHAGAPIRQLANEAGKYQRAYNVNLNLITIGRSGREQEKWIKEWKSAGLTTMQLGEHSDQKISEILAQTKFGFFSTPIALAEKSGSVAAMREHGIHLLCVSRSWHPRGIHIQENPYGILQYEEGSLEHFFSTKPDFSYMPTLSKVSEQFISNLLNIN